VRFLFLSGTAFFAAGIAGRLTEKVPTKWLIGPGFLVLGTGLLLLRGIQPDSEWTHLIPGLLVSGVGIGMINTPLASTAVGVVSVDRAGMASGINSTLRQVGVATGIATLGSIFSHEVADGVTSGLAGTPVAGDSDRISAAITGGQVDSVLQAAPSGVREQIAAVATSSFVDALDHITVIAAVVAFTTAVLCFVLIRQRDFVAHPGEGAPAVSE
jgi:hypothetical protein